MESYDDTGESLHENAPHLPAEVRARCIQKGIPMSDLAYNGLCGYWYPLSGWKGMFLGIEPDGHAHT